MSFIKNRKNESGVSIFAVVMVLMILGIAGAVLSQFVGPVAGWADPYLKQETPVKTKPKQEEKTSPQPVVPTVDSSKTEENTEKAVTKDPEPTKTEENDSSTVEAEPELSESEKVFNELVAKYLAETKPVKVGQKITLPLKNNQTSQGEIITLTDGRIELKEEYGRITYTIEGINPKVYPFLFPKRYAESKAAKELPKVMEERRNAKLSKPTSTAGLETPAVAVNKPANKPSVGRGIPAYDTSSATTPDELKPYLKEFASWARAQSRRMGAALVVEARAKNHNGHMTLYIQPSDTFMKQSYDFRFTITEGIWKLWSLKCFDNGLVASPQYAHVVLMDKDKKIVGGSKAENASGLWVKK